MKTCNVCGKKGLFQIVNSDGRCSKCEYAFQEEKRKEEKERREREVSAAQDYYLSIHKLFTEINEDIYPPVSAPTDSDTCRIIEQKISSCEHLIDLLKLHIKYPALNELLFSKVTYNGWYDEKNDIGTICDFGVSSLHRNSPSFVAEFFSALTQSIATCKKQWERALYHRKKLDAFTSTLSSLERFSIQTTDPVERLGAYHGEIKHAPFTPKTNFEQASCFTVIDVETTGLRPARDRVIEIAAIRFENWEPVMCFESLINPGTSISETITEITGITSDMVSSSPSFGQIVASLDAFIGKSNIVGHNLDFDLRFLYAGGYDFTKNKRKYYDTLSIAQKTLKLPRKKWDKELECYEINYDVDYDVYDHKLETLCNYYQIRDNACAHRATSDCLAAGYLFGKLAAEKQMTTVP